MTSEILKQAAKLLRLDCGCLRGEQDACLRCRTAAALESSLAEPPYALHREEPVVEVQGEAEFLSVPEPPPGDADGSVGSGGTYQDMDFRRDVLGAPAEPGLNIGDEVVITTTKRCGVVIGFEDNMVKLMVGGHGPRFERPCNVVRKCRPHDDFSTMQPRPSNVVHGPDALVGPGLGQVRADVGELSEVGELQAKLKGAGRARELVVRYLLDWCEELAFTPADPGSAISIGKVLRSFLTVKMKGWQVRVQVLETANDRLERRYRNLMTDVGEMRRIVELAASNGTIDQDGVTRICKWLDMMLDARVEKEADKS